VSTRYKIVTAGVLLAAAAFIALRVFKSEPGRDRAEAAFHQSVAHKAGERLDEQSRGRESSAPPERSALADALNSPNTDIRADLKLVLEVIDTFRSNFPQTGNPVGSNAEITAALTGRNRLRLSLIPADHPAINQDGELCDRWGTPFFFHAESATRIEIRSAGPDKKMWSGDDVILSP
jgi:hypothetical protein